MAFSWSDVLQRGRGCTRALWKLLRDGLLTQDFRVTS